MRISAPKSDLHLFISCSVSLILIMMFLLIDLDKFNDAESNTHIQSALNEVKKEIEKERYSIDCYRIDAKTGQSIEPVLTQEHIDSLATTLYNGNTSVSDDTINILKVRDACGYVYSDIFLKIPRTTESSTIKISTILKNYVNLRHQLKNISKSTSVEVEM